MELLAEVIGIAVNILVGALVGFFLTTGVIRRKQIANLKWGVLFRWGSWWIGGHWSDHNKRLCVNPVPMVTIWITAQGGETPEAGYGFDIYRSDKNKPKPNLRITNVVDHQLIDDFIRETKASNETKEKIASDAREQLLASQKAKLEEVTMNEPAVYNRRTESQRELAVAEKILALVNAEIPKDPASQTNAIWLAFQAHYGPASAGHELRNYGFICSHK